MSIMPKSENLRKAVKFISDQRKFHPEKKENEMVAEACAKFDLSPLDSEFLVRFVKSENS